MADDQDPDVVWRELLAGRAIPDSITAASPYDPWRHEPARFEPPAEPADTPSRDAALAFLGAGGGTVLDVGCGAGAAGVALAGSVTHLTGTDISPEMLAAFELSCSARGIPHRAVLGAWPDTAAEAGPADVVVCHHVGYNTAELAPFVTALDAAARRGVVLELHDEHPMAWLDPLWEQLHGLRRPRAATADDALAVLRGVDIEPREVRWRRPSKPRDPEEELQFASRKLCLPPERSDDLAAALADLPPRHRQVVTFSWVPRHG